MSQAAAEGEVRNGYCSITIPFGLGGVEDKPVFKESQRVFGARLCVQGFGFLGGIIKGGGGGKGVCDFSIPRHRDWPSSTSWACWSLCGLHIEVRKSYQGRSLNGSGMYYVLATSVWILYNSLEPRLLVIQYLPIEP